MKTESAPVVAPAPPESIAHLHSNGDFCRERELPATQMWPVELFTGQQMYERDLAWLALIAELQSKLSQAEKDARRWGVVMNCVRVDQFGGWTVHEDDPHDDASIKAKFIAAIDAALSQEQQEGEKR